MFFHEATRRFTKEMHFCMRGVPSRVSVEKLNSVCLFAKLASGMQEG